MTTKILLPLLFLTCLAAYSSSLSGGFVWDDMPQIVENPYIKNLANTPLYFKKSVWSLSRMQEKYTPYYRPIFLLSIALDYKTWGLNPFGYRITNLFLHFIIISFVYLIADMILKDKTGALTASAVFAMHPANTEVVAWISGRTDMIAGIFLLPAFFLHHKKQYYFSIPFFAFALLSKETSVVFPLLIAFYSIINGKKLLEILKEMISYLVLIIIYFAVRSMVIDSNGIGLAFTSANFALLAKAILHYFRFLIFPWPIAFIPNNTIPKTLLFDIIGTIVFLGIIVFSFRKNRKVVMFLLLWIALTFLPTFATLFNPLLNNFAYRFFYFPLVGYAIIIGVFASNIIRDAEKTKKYAVTVGLVIVILIYGYIIHLSGFTYRSTMSLWENSLKYFPDSAFAHNSMASSEDDIERQIYHFKMAIKLNPNSGNSYIGLGTAYGKLGNYALAAEYIGKGIKQASTYVSISAGYNSLGNIYYLEGHIPEAKEMYRKAVEIDNLNAEAYYNLALALKNMGMPEEAFVYMKKYESLISGSTGSIESE